MKYTVERMATVWYRTEVEADSREDAIDLADFDNLEEASFAWTDEYWTDKDEN